MMIITTEHIYPQWRTTAQSVRVHFLPPIQALCVYSVFQTLAILHPPLTHLLHTCRNWTFTFTHRVFTHIKTALYSVTGHVHVMQDNTGDRGCPESRMSPC